MPKKVKKPKKPTKVEMSPKLYVDLTLKMLPVLIEKIKDELAKHKPEWANAGREEADQIILQVVINLRREIGKDLLTEGITDESIEQYMQEHAKEVDAYLAKNPDIQRKFNELEKEFEAKFPK